MHAELQEKGPLVLGRHLPGEELVLMMLGKIVGDPETHQSMELMLRMIITEVCQMNGATLQKARSL